MLISHLPMPDSVHNVHIQRFHFQLTCIFSIEALHLKEGTNFVWFYFDLQVKVTFGHFDDLVIFEILRNLDIWDLANVAMVSTKMKEHAESTFRRGPRKIKIDDSKTLMETNQVLRQFGPWAKSIAITGSGEPFYLMKVLSVIQPADEGNLKALSLRKFKLNLFGSLKLTREERVRVHKLLENLKEISFTDCHFTRFSSVFSRAANSLEKITLKGCRLDTPTKSLWRESYPNLQKLVLINSKYPDMLDLDSIIDICQGSPNVQKLTFDEGSLGCFLTDAVLDAIQNMSRLSKLELVIGDEYPFYLGAHAPPQLQSLKLKMSYESDDELFRVLSNISQMKNLTELHIEGINETGRETTWFSAFNEHNPVLDFPKLEKLTINAKKTDLKLFHHVFCHMRNLTFFSFHGGAFKNDTLRKLVGVAPQLQIVNIVAQSPLGSLQNVMNICQISTMNDLIMILRGQPGQAVRVHRHPNGLLLYLCDGTGPPQQHMCEEFEIGDGKEFVRALEIAERNVCVQLNDGF